MAMKFERPKFVFMNPRRGRSMEEIDSQVAELKGIPLDEAERIIAEKKYMKPIDISGPFRLIPGNPFNLWNLHIVPTWRDPKDAPDLPMVEYIPTPRIVKPRKRR